MEAARGLAEISERGGGPKHSQATAKDAPLLWPEPASTVSVRLAILGQLAIGPGNIDSSFPLTC